MKSPARLAGLFAAGLTLTLGLAIAQTGPVPNRQPSPTEESATAWCGARGGFGGAARLFARVTQGVGHGGPGQRR